MSGMKELIEDLIIFVIGIVIMLGIMNLFFRLMDYLI